MNEKKRHNLTSKKVKLKVNPKSDEERKLKVNPKSDEERKLQKSRETQWNTERKRRDRTLRKTYGFGLHLVESWPGIPLSPEDVAASRSSVEEMAAAKSDIVDQKRLLKFLKRLDNTEFTSSRFFLILREARATQRRANLYDLRSTKELNLPAVQFLREVPRHTTKGREGEPMWQHATDLWPEIPLWREEVDLQTKELIIIQGIFEYHYVKWIHDLEYGGICDDVHYLRAARRARAKKGKL